MAKKKGATLSELDAFLKKDPNSLADVEKLSGQSIDKGSMDTLSIDQLVAQIKQIAANEKESETQILLKLILSALENKTEESSSDILLMNTALYLQHAEKTGKKLKDLL